MRKNWLEYAEKLLPILKLRSTSEIASEYFGNRLIDIYLQKVLEGSTKIDNQPQQKLGKKTKAIKPKEIPLYPLI